MIRSQAPQRPLSGALQVTIHAVYKVPKSWSKEKKRTHIDQPKTSTPDVDNIFKFYTDAMNGIFYNDDAQIASAKVVKQYSDHDAVIIYIEPISCLSP